MPKSVQYRGRHGRREASHPNIHMQGRDPKLVRPSGTRTAVLLGVLLLALTVQACGSTSTKTEQSQDLEHVVVDEEAAALLPKSVADRGALRVATELSWPPFTYKDSAGQATGVDINLIRAVAKKLGLKTQITDSSTASIIPSIQNGRFDVAVTQLAITEERLAAVQFVPYIENSLGLMVRGNEVDDISPKDLCGRTLVGTKSTGSLTLAQDYSKQECVEKGKPEIEFIVFDDTPETILALGSGRGEGFVADNAVGTYLSKNSSADLVMDDGMVPVPTTESGIAISQGNDELAAAVQAALVSLVDDGTYKSLLADVGIAEQALTEEEIRD